MDTHHSLFIVVDNQSAHMLGRNITTDRNTCEPIDSKRTRKATEKKTSFKLDVSFEKVAQSAQEGINNPERYSTPQWFPVCFAK